MERQPLGGVKKETFVHSAAHNPALNAELTFDLIVGIKSDLCHEIKQIQCQPPKCAKKFLQIRHVKIAGIVLISILIGYGALSWKAIFKFLPFL